MVWISFTVATLAACREPRTLTSRSASSPEATEALVTVTGRVHDTLVQPVSDATVEVVGIDGASALTDTAGRFSISFQRAPSQALVVRIAKEGFHEVRLRDVLTPIGLVVRLVPLEIMRLAAAYTLTFEAAACEIVPAHLRRRTYTVSVGESDSPVGGLFRAALGGADFYPGYDAVSVMAGQARATLLVFSWFASQQWLEDQPIFERLSPSGYLAVMGTGDIGPPAADSTISGKFDGSFSYCSSSVPNSNPTWPPVCTAPTVACRSADHRLTLVPQVAPITSASR